MAISRPPKSPYGDTEFTTDDDNWSQGNNPSGQNYAPARNQQPLPIYDQLPNPKLNAPGQSRDSSPKLSDLANVTQSITQEDLLFMRGWQRDSFIKRVVPLTALATGALFFYNKQKNLPHKASRYFFLSIGTYLLGKWSYKDEFKRRLIESRSNTPYMQALRKTMGLPPIAADDSGFDSMTSDSFGSSTSDWNEPFSSSSQGSQSAFAGQLGYQAPPSESLDNSGLEPIKQGATYEELRARNRGLNSR